MENKIQTIDGVEYLKVPAYRFQNGLPACFTKEGLQCHFLSHCGGECCKCLDEEKNYIFILNNLTEVKG